MTKRLKDDIISLTWIGQHSPDLNPIEDLFIVQDKNLYSVLSLAQCFDNKKQLVYAKAVHHEVYFALYINRLPVGTTPLINLHLLPLMFCISISLIFGLLVW